MTEKERKKLDRGVFLTMIWNKQNRKILAVLVVLALIFTSTEISKVQADASGKAPAFSTKEQNLLVGKSAVLKISNPVSGAKKIWSSSNKKVVTVTGNGVIKGIKKGTAVVKCSMKKGSRNDTITCKVTVRTAASKVSISNKITTMKLGDTYTLNGTISPKSSNDVITWTSSDKMIAAPNKYGSFQAEKEGIVTITATTLSGKKDSVKINVSAESKEVSVQSELDAALTSAADKIIIKTSKELAFTIKAGDYTDKMLIVDAPNADVTNHGTFKDVTINAIKANTWYENAINNMIYIRAAAARIVVSENASTSVDISAENSNIALENNGTIQSVNIDGAGCSVNLSGTSTVPVPMNANGENAVITTAIPVALQCNAPIQLNIQSGAQQSTVRAKNAGCIPQISGSTSIVVFVGTGDASYSVTLDPSGSSSGSSSGGSTEEPEIPGASGLSGKLSLSDAGAVSGAAVCLAKYDGSAPGTPAYNAAVYSAASSPNYVALPDMAGGYQFKNIKEGNYIVLGIMDGYGIHVSSILIEKGTKPVLNITLSPIESGSAVGKVSGHILNATTAKPIPSGIFHYEITSDSVDVKTIDLDKLINSMPVQGAVSGSAVSGSAVSGSAIGVIGSAKLENDTIVVSVSGSAFTFNLPGGLFNVKVSDITEYVNESDRYMDTEFTLFTIDQVNFENQNCIMTKKKEKGQAAFVLTWGQYPYDLDSHLLGPDSEGEIQHLYFGNRQFYDPSGKNLDLNLDVDDTTSYGPETVSIYHAPEKSAKYVYYVHNYSGNQDASIPESGARVTVATSTDSKVFDASKAELNLLSDKEEKETGRFWVVCVVDANTGEITPVNKIAEKDPDYSEFIK